MMFAVMHTEALTPSGPRKLPYMLYTLIAISFISTVGLLGLDAFRHALMQMRIKHYYRKLVDVAFVLTIASIILTSVIGFVQKGNTTATAQQVAER